MAGTFTVVAQQLQYNFRHFSPNEGLSNDAVRGIAQDKYGFIWIGTNYGLNRFDGTRVKKYFWNPNDSTSISNDFVRSMYGDKQGRIWIGSDPGFSLYDYERDCFIRFGNSYANILAITEDKDGVIWTATSRGLRYTDIKNRQLVDAIVTDTSLNKLLHLSIRDIFYGADEKFYLATGKGVVIMDWKTKKWELISKQETGTSLIGGNDVQSVAVDKSNRLWVALNFSYSALYCISSDRKSSTEYTYFQKQQGDNIPNSIRTIVVDNKNRVWFGSTYFGISLFQEKTNDFISFTHNPAIVNSLSASHCTQILEDKTGMIWVGTEGNGIDYFHPDQGLFSGVENNPYLPMTILDNWGRTVAEDSMGNLWLGTGKGISIFNFQKGVIKNYTNKRLDKKELQSQSIRSFLYDKDGTMWIGTADGINRFHPSTGKMEFFEDKDSIPRFFTWFIKQLRNGKILTGGNRGLYEYLPATNKFYDYAKHPVLKEANLPLHAFAEDAKGRWWIGTFGNGVIVYDPAKDKIIKKLAVDSTGILTNNFIQSFCEDKLGNMWIGTRANLICYNVETNVFSSYGEAQGLPNSWISGIIFDKTGRLWIGTGNGLCVMNENKKIVRVFGLADGLTTTQFNEQDAFETSTGLFVFPTHKGFTFFRPEQFDWKQVQPPVYLTSFKVANKELVQPINLEEVKSIQLKYFENFFAIELTGLNYANPQQCWYAYKLDGFDKDWIYTQQSLINYTNVPGGGYTFRYKVSLDPTNWNVEEKTIQIHIGKVFYKTVWFWTLIIGLLVCLLFWFYKNRIRQQQQVYSLKSKAQSLEKEKALVMYEGLKQQLNPHFLFNSLTSLNSLISTDPVTANKFLDNLSKTYRYILKSRDSETVPLKDEIKFAESYVKLQQTRFEKGFTVNMKIDEEYFHRMIVPVTLQNLIENAIKHNIIDADEPLVVDIYASEDYLFVKNNLQKKNFVETSNKQGLANLQSLYHYLSNRPLEISEDGNYFTVKIPLL